MKTILNDLCIHVGYEHDGRLVHADKKTGVQMGRWSADAIKNAEGNCRRLRPVGSLFEGMEAWSWAFSPRRLRCPLRDLGKSGKPLTFVGRLCLTPEHGQ
jgi:hypothetical protein